MKNTEIFIDANIIIDVLLQNELNEAIELTEIEDLEDALQAVCAKKRNSEFIVTRDLSGFKYSPVKAISPAEFIKKFG